MKITAMQELIQHIQNNATKFSLMNTYNILKEIKPYLEKEKEQIIDAFKGGMNSDDYLVPPNWDDEWEEYYNQAYNQNKKYDS